MTEQAWMKGLRQLVSAMERMFGRGTLRTLPVEVPPRARALSSGVASLDALLAGDGVPLGTMVELFGADSVGKTSLALSMAAAAQADGGLVAWIDAERSLQRAMAEGCGVDLSRLLIAEPDDAETALSMVEALVRSGAVRLVVLDSVAAMLPRAEIGRPLDADVGAGTPRLMSRALRRLVGTLAGAPCAVVFVNQGRRELGDAGQTVDASGGGTALRFYAGIRCELRREGELYEGDACVGEKIRVEVVKNRFGTPRRAVSLALRWGTGFRQAGRQAEAPLAAA